MECLALIQLAQADLWVAQSTLVHELQTQLITEEQIETQLDLDEDETDEDQIPQFYPTLTFSGEAILGISDVIGEDTDESMVFGASVELIFNASFTGEDSLEVGIESGNMLEFAFIDETTNQGRLEFFTDTDGGSFELSELSYELEIGERTTFYLATTGSDIKDFNPFLENSSDSSDGAVSEFGTENPIHSLVEDVGWQLDYELSETTAISLGYFFGEAAYNPEIGLFDGNQSAFVQLELEIGDRGLIGFTYVRNHHDSALETDTGSFRSQVNLERPIVGNSYGISTFWTPDFQLAVGGWLGFTHASIEDLGDAYIWNYAITLNLLDFGQEGNVLGLIVGQEPKLTGTSGFEIDGSTEDPDTSFHLEAFYRYLLDDHISITPGIVWITAPDHNHDNADIFVFTIRSTFEF